MQLGAGGQVTAMHLSGTSDDGPLEFLLVDDMFYVANEDDSGALVWTGASVLEDANAELLAAVLSGNIFLNAFATRGVFTPTRADDQTMSDQAMIVFESDVDLVSFLSTPTMLNLIGDVIDNVPGESLGASDGGSLGQATDADLEGAIQLLPILLNVDTVEVALWVGAEDGLVHHVDMLIDVVLDATMIDPELGEVGFRLEVTSTLDGHGGDYDFSAPADFAPLDTSTFDLIPVDAFNMGGGPTENISDAERYAVEESISYGETVSGTLSDGNTQDVWGFEAEAGDVVTIVLKAAQVESSLDTQIYLRDDEGAELAFNDDHDGTRTDLAIFDSLVSAFEIPADGSYRIVATWLTETRDGDYELTLEVVE
jgi:hypothetical protein